MSVRDEWKNTGKDLSDTFKGLGKSIVKSVKVGADKILDEEPKDENGNVKPTGLKESWSEVGHNFGKSGKSIGKAVTETAKVVVKKADEELNKTEAQPEQPFEDKTAEEEPAEEKTEEKTEE